MIECLKKYNKAFFVLVLIFVIQLILYTCIGLNKQALFCDETLSYGFANSEEYNFLDAIPQSKWVSSDVFVNYLTSSPNKAFNLWPTYRNQIYDAHPPLYNSLIHIVSSFLGTNFNIWPGIGINLFLLIFSDLLLFYISSKILNSRPYALLVVILYSFSSSGISNVLLTRMYFLLSVCVLAYIAIHLKIFNSIKISKTDYCLIFLTVIIGGLTHYYFYVFAGAFSFLIFIYLLVNKKLGIAFSYILIQFIAFIANLLYFPATITQIFASMRGVEVINNLNLANIPGRKYLIFNYLNFINDSFGRFILPLLIICAFVFLVAEIKRNSVDFKSFIKDRFVYIVTIITTFIFLFFVTRGSEIVNNRYIYSIYPIISLIIVNFVHIIFNHLKIKSLKLPVLIIFTMCISGIKTFGIEYLYLDYGYIHNLIKNYKGYDCLLYRDTREWLDIYTGIQDKLIFDEICHFDEFDYEQMGKILNERQSENPLVIFFPTYISESDKAIFLKEMAKHTKYKNIKHLYDYIPFKQSAYVIN